MSVDQPMQLLAVGAQNPPPETGDPVAGGVAVEELEENGLGAELNRPAGAKEGKRILYIHGGGWLFTTLLLGDRHRTSPEVTPFDADMTGLPPTLIHVDSWELLRSDSETLAGRMRAAGVPVALKVWDGMCHNHQLFAPFLAEGMASLEEAGGCLGARLG